MSELCGENLGKMNIDYAPSADQAEGGENTGQDNNQNDGLNPEDLERAANLNDLGSLFRHRLFETHRPVDLDNQKREIYSGLNPKLQDYLDLYITSIDSHKIQHIIQEINKQRATQNPPISLENFLKHNLRQIKEIVNKAVDSWIAETEASLSKHAPEVQDEFTQKKTEISEKAQKFWHNVTIDIAGTLNDTTTRYGIEESLQRKMQDIEQEYIAAYLIFNTQNSFYIKEYLKGRISKLFKEDEKNLEKLSNGDRTININPHQKEEIFKELREIYLLKHGAGEGGTMGGFYQRVKASIDSVMDDEFINQGLKFASGKEITFDNLMQLSSRQNGVKILGPVSTGTNALKYVYGSFFGVLKRLDEFHGNARSFMKALNEGKIEDVVHASENIQTADIDLVLNQAEEIRTAMSLYSLGFHQTLADNGGVLTEDFLAKGPSGSNRLDTEIGNTLQNTYNLSDEETEFYLDIGKAMAFSSGNLLLALINAMPNMAVNIEYNQNSTLDEKMKNGSLTLKEFLLLQKTVSKKPLGYPFRSFLMSANRFKNLEMWAIPDLLHIDDLILAPIMPGKGLLSTIERYRLAKEVKNAIYLGCNDESAPLLQKGVFIPAIDLTKILNMVNVQTRAGWRDEMIGYLNKDFPTKEFKTIEDKISALNHLLDQFGPWVAWEFVNNPPTDKLNIKKGSANEQEILTSIIINYCHLHYPSLFTAFEERRFFRSNELTFNSCIEDLILKDLRISNRQTLKYQLFLRQDELTRPDGTEPLAENSSPSPLSNKVLADFTRARYIKQRLGLTMQAVEAAASNLRYQGKRLSLADFFNDPQKQDPAFQTLREVVLREMKLKIGYDVVNIPEELKNINDRNWETSIISLNVPKERKELAIKQIKLKMEQRDKNISRQEIVNLSNQEIIQAAVKEYLWSEQLADVFYSFGKETFYGEDSIYAKTKFLSNQILPPEIVAQKKQLINEFQQAEKELADKYTTQEILNKKEADLEELIAETTENLRTTQNSRSKKELEDKIKEARKDLSKTKRRTILSDAEMKTRKKELEDKRVRLQQRIEEIEEASGVKISIKAVYSNLIKDELISSPFDWMYIGQALLNAQGTGSDLLARNTSDTKSALEALGKASDSMVVIAKLASLQTDAKTSKRDKITTGIVDYLKDLGKTISPGSGIAGKFGRDNALTFGSLVKLFVESAFVGPRTADFGIGASWISQFHEDDPNRQCTLMPQNREKIIKELKDLQSTEAVIANSEKNEIVTDIVARNLPFGLGKLFPKKVWKTWIKEGRFGDLSVEGQRLTNHLERNYTYFHALLFWTGLVFLATVLPELWKQINESLNTKA